MNHFFISWAFAKKYSNLDNTFIEFPSNEYFNIVMHCHKTMNPWKRQGSIKRALIHFLFIFFELDLIILLLYHLISSLKCVINSKIGRTINTVALSSNIFPKGITFLLTYQYTLWGSRYMKSFYLAFYFFVWYTYVCTFYMGLIIGRQFTKIIDLWVWSCPPF